MKLKELIYKGVIGDIIRSVINKLLDDPKIAAAIFESIPDDYDFYLEDGEIAINKNEVLFHWLWDELEKIEVPVQEKSQICSECNIF